MTPTQILWDLAGRPHPSKTDYEDVPGTCLVCGGHSEQTVPEKKAIPRGSSNRHEFRAPWSDRVCAGCLWCSEGGPPDTLRLWSIVYSAEGVRQRTLFADYMEKKERPEKPISVRPLESAGHQLCLTNKKDLTPATALLCNPTIAPYFVALADSGQIHVVRNCVINRGDSWTVQFEREAISSDAQTFSRILYHATELRLAGFFDDEILPVEPSSAHLLKAPGAWMNHAPQLEPWAHSDVLRMALFTITKDTLHEHNYIAREAVGAAYRADIDARGGGPFASLLGVDPERQYRPKEILGSCPEGPASRIPARRDHRADGERDARATEHRAGVHEGIEQQDLFDL